MSALEATSDRLRIKLFIYQKRRNENRKILKKEIMENRDRKISFINLTERRGVSAANSVVTTTSSLPYRVVVEALPGLYVSPA